MDISNIKLVFYCNGQIIKKISIQSHKDFKLTIGRSQEVDIMISHNEISKNHAVIYATQSQLFVEDLQSTNGTFFNNQQINGHVKYPIQIGDKIYFSNNRHTYLEVFEEIKQVESPAFRPNNDLSAVINSKGKAKIGRSEDCDLTLLHPQISRLHCEISKNKDGSFQLKDFSKNGTYVNGKKIYNTLKINSSDKIMIGPYVISISGIVQDISKEVAIRVEGVEKIYNNGYKALNNCYFTIPSHNLMAIMGPSGCGKSTLLKTLNGESPATRGKIYLFNQELISNYEYLKTLIGYVPQDDIVHKELTVEQSLYYAAKLRLENRTDKEIYDKIDHILNSLNIGFIKKQLVGKISGGQRKRVSIAVELLTDPLILFLDEPTSPLDPQTIEEFLKILKNLAQNGTTVIMVTHKPEDLEYMDSAMFLAEGGYIVYDGPSNKYFDYFDVSSAVEVYAQLVGNKSQKWINKFQNENNISKKRFTQNKRKEAEKTAHYWKQLYWLSVRYLKIKTNDKVNSAILIFQAPIIAALICLIFDYINQAVPFLISISAVWFGTNNAAREIVGELPIYSRERMFNLKINTYILSKIVVLTLFAFVQALLFISIISLRYEDPVWTSFFGSIFWMVIISTSSTLMGLYLSSAVNTTEKVMSIVPISLIPQIMLGGVIAKITSPIVEYLSYFTVARWGTEGMTILQEKVYSKDLIDTVANNEHNVDAISLLKLNFYESYEDLFGEHASSINLDFIALIILGITFYALTYYSLKKKDAINF